jgi:hypothetical protein
VLAIEPTDRDEQEANLRGWFPGYGRRRPIMQGRLFLRPLA